MKRLALACALLALASSAFMPPALSRAADSTPISTRRALAQTVTELDVEGKPIAKVIDFLRDVSGANLVVNWKALEAAGVTRDTTISLRVRNVSLRKLLQLVLSQASPNSPLTYAIDNNVIEITSQEEQDRTLVTKVYIVDDLVMINNQNAQAPRINLQAITGGNGGSGGGNFGSGSGGGNFGSGGSSQGLFQDNGNQQTQQQQQTSDQKGQELVDLIKSVIRPSIWSDNGGTATIRYFRGKLIVTAPVSVQEAIGGPINDYSSAIRFGN